MATRVRKFNISIPEKYTSQGQEKTFWNNVGTIALFRKDDGSESMLVKIPAIGMSASAFEQKDEPRGNYQKQNSGQTSNLEQEAGVDTVDSNNSDINPEDLPF